MADVVSIENLRKRIKETEQSANQKVCVVCVIGKCHLDQKNGVLNKLVDHSVFNGLSTLLQTMNKEKTKEKDEKNSCGGEKDDENEDDVKKKQLEVKMFYDEEQKTVFVQLNSIYDYGQLFKACQNLHDNLSMGFRHKCWQDKLLKHALALLFIFSISHIVVVMFPTPRFDLSYLRLFKLLAAARYNMLHGLSQSLNSVEGIPEIWRTTGRPCIPRIIFSFQVPWASAKGLNQHSIRKMQLSLQEQTHLILKKNRLLGSLSSSSLFTVSSPNQLFVHVQTENRSIEPLFALLNHSIKNSLNLTSLQCPTSSKISSSSLISQPSPNKGGLIDDSNSTKDVSLRDFLYKQIDYMMTVESREVPAEGRRGTHVEAPTIGLWYRVCEVVYDYFLGTALDNNSHVKSLSQSLDLDWKFSENRCHKVSPMATSAYLDNLPSHYVQSVHLAQLSHCLRVFAMNARGPAYEHYANQLQEECNQVWWNGRHLCEVMSMTGQPCVYPYHNIPDGKAENAEEKTGIPVKSHSSRVTSIAACNCGRTQGTREDPFDLKEANYEFYQNLEKKCCSYLTHLKFPSFPIDDPSVKEKTKPSLQKRLETHQITILGRNSKTSLSELSFNTGPSQQQTEDNGDEGKTDAKEDEGETQDSQHETVQMNGIHAEEADPEKPVKNTADECADAALSDRLSSISAVKNLTEASLSYGGGSTFQIQGTSDAQGECTTSFLSQYEDMVQATKTLSVQQQGQEENLEDHSLGSESANTSGMDYYEGMMTINLQSGLLPLFPSWSLIVLGPASLYNPAKGVEQAGFFSGSNYLLLWDITVRTSDIYPVSENKDEVAKPDISNQKEQWPAPGEAAQAPSPSGSNALAPTHGPASHVPFFQTMSQVQTQVTELAQSEKTGVNKMKMGNFKDTTSVKAYIGNEYECPRGHRFFCSAPDKMVKVSASGHTRENATKLVSGHMPLYFPCPCRSSKPLHLAKITRTYVVTPDSSITLTLNPRVQPGERDVTPIFYTGLREGITLPASSYCVLRYPFVYVDYNGPILPPAPSQPLLTCRLLKGMFNYSHATVNEENLIQS